MNRSDRPDGFKALFAAGPSQTPRRLLAARAIAAAVLLLAAAWFYALTPEDTRREWLLVVVAAQMALLLIQWGLLRTSVPADVQTGFQLLGDLALVAALVYATGGVDSPFTFLFGLIIIASGVQARPMLPVSVAVVACAAWLLGVYGFSWQSHQPLAPRDAIHALLQVSALLLAGGLMGGLARRQQTLLRERSQARRRHRQLEALHGRIMDALHDGVLALDADQRIVDGNRAMRSMLGGDEAILGRSLDQVMKIPEPLRRFLSGAGGDVCRCEWRRQGRIYLLGATRLPAEDDAAWLITAADVTELRMLERRLAEREKLAFLGRLAAMLAHEIRNPLHSIGQAIDLLASADGQREVGDIMREEVRRLDRLVRDMLDYARPMTPKPALVAVRPILETAIARVGASLGEAGSIELECDDTPVVLDADHLRLVVDNLLRNALQAGDGAGLVRIEFRTRRDGQWALRVQDEAGGVPEEAKATMFEPFASGRPDGSGLGLATVWQVCRVNDWKIEVENVTTDNGGRGAAFTVRGGASGGDSAG